jgi:hypothetical protein
MTALSGVINPSEEFLTEVFNRSHVTSNQIEYLSITDDRLTHPLLLMKDISDLKDKFRHDLSWRENDHYWWALAKRTDDVELLKLIISNSTDTATLIIATERLHELGEIDHVTEIALNRLQVHILTNEIPLSEAYFDKPFTDMHYDGLHGIMSSAQRRAIDLLSADLNLLRKVENYSTSASIDMHLCYYYEELDDLVRLRDKWEKHEDELKKNLILHSLNPKIESLLNPSECIQSLEYPEIFQ